MNKNLWRLIFMNTKFIGVWGGYTVLQKDNGEYVVEETGKCFSTKQETFHKCMVDDVYV